MHREDQGGLEAPDRLPACPWPCPEIDYVECPVIDEVEDEHRQKPRVAELLLLLVVIMCVRKNLVRGQALEKVITGEACAALTM